MGRICCFEKAAHASYDAHLSVPSLVIRDLCVSGTGSDQERRWLSRSCRLREWQCAISLTQLFLIDFRVVAFAMVCRS